jgi:hypothetical protein
MRHSAVAHVLYMLMVQLVTSGMMFEMLVMGLVTVTTVVLFNMMHIVFKLMMHFFFVHVWSVMLHV